MAVYDTLDQLRDEIDYALEDEYNLGYDNGYADGYASRSLEIEEAVDDFISETETTPSELKTAIQQITGITL